MQSSHVIGFLLLVAPRALPRRSCRYSLLPNRAVALRLDAVVPGHVLPPSRVEAASLMPAAPMSFPVWPRGRLLALIPRHEEPPSLAETARLARTCSRHVMRRRAALIPRHGTPPRRVSSPCLIVKRDVRRRRRSLGWKFLRNEAYRAFHALSLLLAVICPLICRLHPACPYTNG